MVVGFQPEELDTIVIGSGPGGYVAAIRAAELGQKVTVIEKEFIGGVCLNVGCIPSKALINAGHHYQAHLTDSVYGLTYGDVKLDFTATQQWKDEKVVKQLTDGIAMLLKKHKIDVIMGEASFNDNQSLNIITKDEKGEEGHKLVSFKNCIIATGSRPIEIPSLKFGGRIIDSTGVLNLKEIPEKLVVVGGGVIGAELGSAYQALGSDVTIVEGLDHVLNGFDSEMAKPVVEDFIKSGGDIYTNAVAKSASQTDKDVTLTFEYDGKDLTATGDYLLVSVGRRANTDNIGLNNTDVKVSDRGIIEINDSMQTSVPHIYAIGDVVPGPMLAHKGSFQGKVAAAAISGAENAVDMHIAMPAVAYTHFELATVGETPDTIADRKADYKISKFPMAGNGRALSMNATVGFVRLISEKETGALVGAQITGEGASDLISELSLAIENGLTTEDISLTIHPHPTLGEAIMDAAEVADGLGIHI